MNCKFCDEPIAKLKGNDKPRAYCDEKCYRASLRQKGNNIFRAGSFDGRDLISKLFARARKGDELAKLELKLRHNVTNYWNGKELVSISLPIDSV